MPAVLSFVLCAASAVLPGEDAYFMGREDERAGRYPRASGAYLECENQNGPLAPYAAIRAAVCQSARGDPAGALARLSALLETHPRGPWVPMAKNEMALTLVLLNRHKEAATLFAGVVDVDYTLWWLDRYRWSAAENDLAIDEKRAASLTYFRHVVESTPYPALRLDAAHLLALSSRTEDRIAAAGGMLRSRAYGDAEKLAATFSPTLLNDPDISARWKDFSGRMLIATGKEERGLILLRELIDEFPQSRLARSALLYTLQRSTRENDFDAAELLAQRLATEYPSSRETGDARWALARSYSRHDETDRALHHLEALVESQPSHRRVNRALIATAELYFQQGKNVEALDRYHRLLEGRPGGLLPEGAYKAGDVHLDSGSDETAIEQFRLAVRNGMADFYGHRAQRRLSALEASGSRDNPAFWRVAGKSSLVSPIPRELGGRLRSGQDLLVDDARYQRLFFFGRHGFEEAEWEALELTTAFFAQDSSDDSELPALAEAGTAYSTMQVAYAHKWGDNVDGSQTVERLRVRFPRVHWPEVSALGRETGVDPYMILSIARRESTYRPSLVSPSGAKGVMQLMPKTAQWLAKTEEAITKAQAANLENPINSLRLGAYYLKYLLERYDGNVVFALAAYNAGPVNCDKWRQKLHDHDLPSFIENIPFQETESYVKHVLGFYAAYHSIYPETN